MKSCHAKLSYRIDTGCYYSVHQDAPQPAVEKGCCPADLTLEQYALLRAQLSASGKDEAAVWAEFGIQSRADMERLQARYREIFQRDPHQQATFLEKVRSLTAQLRAKGMGANGI